ncbi:MAG: tetratricopeptide repeat protein [Paludibacter sp.]|nr:tetratricopeptide repeat protein [Paludibacter sp.]
MKTRHVVVLLLSFVMFTNCFAQKENKKNKEGKNAETEAVSAPETPVVTEDCLVNISLFNESAKNKQYADALGPWNKAYAECPGANKAIYSRGREILQWELSTIKDPAVYKKEFDKLMGMYDNRIKYFGDDPKYPTPWILGLKGLDYAVYVKGDDLKKPAYEWLEQSIDALKENSELEVLRVFIVLSNEMFKANPDHAEKFVADYMKVNNILEAMIADSTSRYSQYAAQLKPSIDALLVSSGAADCGTLDNLFKEKVKNNINNADFLTNIVTFYKRIDCTSSDVYFTAAVGLYKLQPSAESASGCAAMSYKKGDNEKAIDFYNEATKLAKDNESKAEYQFTIAQIYYKELNNYSKAREYARNSLEFKPNNGKPYLLIGTMYAKSKNMFSDDILSKAVYWVAVDKFIKARQVDPSCADDANELISTYTKYFPSNDDMFFKPEFQKGKSYFVGGWIGESTTCR